MFSNRDVATAATLRAVQTHGKSRPHAIAVSTRKARLTYAQITAAALGPRTCTAQAVDEVKADRDGTAVFQILASQAAGRPALVYPADAGIGLRSSVNEAIREAAESAQGRGLNAAHEGLLTLTSGSTGQPKVVLHDPHGIDRFTEWVLERLDLGPASVSLSHSPLNFDVALLDVWAVLKAGGRVHFADQHTLTSGSALLEQILNEQVTLVQAVPGILTSIARTGGEAPSVRHVVSTGDFFPPDWQPALRATFPCAELLSIYGATETNDTFVAPLARAAERFLGDPLPGVAVRLSEMKDGKSRLSVSSPYQAIGYLNAANDAWSTAEGRRWFDTADLVEEADGGLRLVGRSDRVVKVRGQRVSLDDIEAVLRRQSGVRDVIAIRDDINETPAITAIVLVDAGQGTSNLALRARVAEHLPTAAVPSRIWLTIEPFARTATGKTDRYLTHRLLLERSNP